MTSRNRFYIGHFQTQTEVTKANTLVNSLLKLYIFFFFFFFLEREYSIFNLHRSDILTTLFGSCMAGATWNCCRPGGNSVYTTQLCTSRLQCHFIQSDIGKMRVFLAVICHLHFRQNDRDLLRATAVTHGWNGYRNKSRHRKLTLEKFILPPLLRGLEPGTFRSRVRRSNHWAILLDDDELMLNVLRCHLTY